MARPLSRRFFARDADVVAKDLLGRILVHASPEGRRAARITETEAYFGPPGAHDDYPEGDPASHAFGRVTDRNRVMHGPPGVWYVYLIYGMHECANVVTGKDGAAQAVLLRAAQPIGFEADLGGPARLCKQLGITRAHNHADATKPPLFFEAGKHDDDYDTTPRIGVDSRLPLRFVLRKAPNARRAVRRT